MTKQPIVSDMRNVLITGVPRSGTTLVCHLLNKIPDVVALHEPMDLSTLHGKSPSEMIDVINAFFKTERERILTTGKATSKSTGGVVPSNHLADSYVEGKRLKLIDGKEISVDNVHSPRFDLFIKHPFFFTAMLPELERSFPCYACIRNPLSVLLSWGNANMQVTNGRAPAAEMADPELARRLDAEQNVLQRQLILMDFLFGRYAASESVRILRYEDVVATSGRALSILHPHAARLDEKLSSRNRREIDVSPEVKRLAEVLMNSENACWKFYTRDDVTELLAGSRH